MGRHAMASPGQEKPVIDGEVVHGQFALAIRAEQEAKAAQENVLALARELAYEGTLTVGGLEDEIRFYQRRSVEALLEVGKRLLLLKEAVGRGSFIEKIEALGFARTTAYRFMAAALRTSKCTNLGQLAKQIDSAGKFLELLTLDDEEIGELAETGSVRGIPLDTIQCLPASALRRRLVEAEARLQAKDRVAENNQKRILALEERLSYAQGKRSAPEFDADNALRALDEQVREIVNLIAAALRAALCQVSAPDLPIGDVLRSQAIHGAVGRVLAAGRQVASDFGVAVTGPDAADGCGEMDAIWAATLADFDAQQAVAGGTSHVPGR